MGLSQVMGVFSASYLEGQGRVTCAQTMRSLTEAPRTPLLPLVPGPSLGWEAGGGGSTQLSRRTPEQGVQVIDFPWPQVDLREVGVPPGHSAKPRNRRWG